MKIWDRQKERNKDTKKDEARYRVAPQLKIYIRPYMREILGSQ